MKKSYYCASPIEWEVAARPCSQIDYRRMRLLSRGWNNFAKKGIVFISDMVFNKIWLTRPACPWREGNVYFYHAEASGLFVVVIPEA